MESLEALRELLVPDILGEIVDENGIHCARLRERSSEAKLKKVNINGVPEESILIKLDKYDQPVSLFNDNKGQRQRCDYVLFSVLNGEGFALFIELKSTKAKKAEFIRQFKGAECVIDYCHSALKRFHNHNQLLNNFSKRFIVFYKPKIAKHRTRPKRSTGNTSPEKAMMYPSLHNPSLKSLLGIESL
jgi:hypothetical protein